MQKIICRKCIYYFITWEPKQPYGCKAYGFKSKYLPSLVVKKESGQECMNFSPKN